MNGKLGRGWLHFPNGTHDAWFDYATAFVGVNSPYDSTPSFEFEGDRAYISNQVVAVIHERAHVLQAATFPWFLRFCALWRSHVLSIRTEQMANGLTWSNVGDLPELLSKERLKEGDELLSLLEATGEAGFSVLELLESHAVYGQLSKLEQRTTESVSAYLRDNGAQPRYRFAYDWTRAQLGDEQALAGFGALVAAAFCFTRPVDAFEELTGYLALFGVERGATLSIPALVDAALVRGFDQDFFGQLGHETGSFAHRDDLPTAAQSQLVLELAAKLNCTVEELLATQEGLGHAIDAMAPTTLYQPDDSNLSGVRHGPTMPIYQRMGWGPEDMPHGFEFKAYQVERFVMAISQLLITTHANSTPAEVPPQFGWLAELSWRPNVVWFPAEGESDDPEKVAELADTLCATFPLNSLSEKSQDTPTVFQHLGRLQLMFQIDTPLAAWQYPWVRNVIRATEHRCPAFPLMLSADQTVLWFASVGDTEAISGEQFEVSHRSVKQAIDRFLDAVGQLQERAQCDFSPLAQRTLGALSRVDLGVASPWRGRRETDF